MRYKYTQKQKGGGILSALGSGFVSVGSLAGRGLKKAGRGIKSVGS